jgi:hypothetical protein
MTNPAFPANIAKALDSYTVPSLPAGFADRLMAKFEAGALPVSVLSVDAPTQSHSLARKSTPWRRSSRIMSAFAAVSLVTATAAASGLLGERVYIPVVSDLLVSANIVAAQQPAPVAAKPKPIPPKAEVKVELPEPVLSGQDLAREMLVKLRQDPAFRRSTPAEKTARIKAEARALLLSGRATPQDIRAARIELAEERKQKMAAHPATKIVKQKTVEWRERYQAATPEEQAAMLEEARRKRQERLARRRGETAADQEPVLSPIE